MPSTTGHGNLHSPAVGLATFSSQPGAIELDKLGVRQRTAEPADHTGFVMSSLVTRRAVLCACLGAGWAAVAPTTSAADPVDPAVAPVKTFYDALLDAMKRASRLSVEARYQRLDAPVRAFFDLPAMARIAVGPAWTSTSADDRAELLAQFARMTIATYASRFDGYSGERFDVKPASEPRGENRVVHTGLVQANGEVVALDYLSHSTLEGWKVIDVYLNGTISELATRRSEFTAILRSGGAAALVASLRQRADKLLAG